MGEVFFFWLDSKRSQIGAWPGSVNLIGDQKVVKLELNYSSRTLFQISPTTTFYHVEWQIVGMMMARSLKLTHLFCSRFKFINKKEIKKLGILNLSIQQICKEVEGI